MATERLKNISGDDLDVPTPDGQFVTVPAGHSAEFEKEHARSLRQQTDKWERYESRATSDTKDKE